MTSIEHSNISKAVIVCLGTVLLGSLGAAASKYIAPTTGAAAIATVQYVCCLVLTLPSILRHGKASLRTQRPALHLFRGLSGALCFYTYFVALEHIPLVDATLLRNSAPLVVPILMLLLMGQPINNGRWLPLIIGFIGIAIVLRPSEGELNIYHFLGFLSAVGLAVSMVTTQMLSSTEPSHRILFYYFTISLVTILPLSLGQWQNIPLSAWPWLIFIGLSMYFAFRLYTYAYSIADATIISPINYFAVVFSGIIGWLVWDHQPDIWTYVGTALICAGGISIVIMGKKKPADLSDAEAN
ncbi:hypothetical protein SIN8267_00733 [Sinobacterium norvegicum]|uniref:EamA domain-containing protein n=1 Tax=Sinobacterium norvegicum TaxID=1641715 RepID=A0ABN8EHQ1_9GAMM|nr:DMT family transporter [Sinobacterium norvegicum]CAH0990639.1 hypothetical protein SIN8267_00733 [Sinobacterium norvegicum]